MNPAKKIENPPNNEQHDNQLFYNSLQNRIYVTFYSWTITYSWNGMALGFSLFKIYISMC